jgi:hypothetical protein
VLLLRRNTGTRYKVHERWPDPITHRITLGTAMCGRGLCMTSLSKRLYPRGHGLVRHRTFATAGVTPPLPAPVRAMQKAIEAVASPMPQGGPASEKSCAGRAIVETPDQLLTGARMAVSPPVLRHGVKALSGLQLASTDRRTTKKAGG